MNLKAANMDVCSIVIVLSSIFNLLSCAKLDHRRNRTTTTKTTTTTLAPMTSTEFISPSTGREFIACFLIFPLFSIYVNAKAIIFIIFFFNFNFEYKNVSGVSWILYESSILFSIDLKLLAKRPGKSSRSRATTVTDDEDIKDYLEEFRNGNVFDEDGDSKTVFSLSVMNRIEQIL